MQFIRNVQLTNKSILLRADLDIPKKDYYRLEKVLPTINYILGKNPKKLTILGHLGRPQGKLDNKFSLQPIQKYFSKIYGEKLIVEENLRFDPGEEANDKTFAEKLAKGYDVFVQEGFSTLHRQHASIVTLPKLVKESCIGIHIQEELENLNKLTSENVQQPYVVIIGGAKVETKQPFIPLFEKIASKVLLGSAYLGQLLDLPQALIQTYVNQITNASTILWNGPVGMYENPSYEIGTKAIANAIANNKKAFTVAGGGDTINALKKFDLLDKIDFVSSGGGAMLQYTAGLELPGLKALEKL